MDYFNSFEELFSFTDRYDDYFVVHEPNIKMIKEIEYLSEHVNYYGAYDLNRYLTPGEDGDDNYCPWNYLIFKDNGEECDGLHAYEVYLTNSEYMVNKIRNGWV